MKILTLCGSLRPDSSNGRLLRLAETLASAHSFDHFVSLSEIPAFDPALDEKAPAPVLDLRQRVKAADAVLISTPEYAHGIPGSLKNALDWMVGSGELVDKTVAVVLASSTDGAFARQALVEVLRTLSAKVPEDLVLGISGIKTKLPLEGKPDEAMIRDLKKLVHTLSL